jgi:hypothetical protein
MELRSLNQITYHLLLLINEEFKRIINKSLDLLLPKLHRLWISVP